jgi:hypothetical protein
MTQAYMRTPVIVLQEDAAITGTDTEVLGALWSDL